MGYNCLRDQVKTYQGKFDSADCLISELPKGFTMEASPAFEPFSGDENLRSIRLHEMTDRDLSVDSCLERKQFDCMTNQASQHRLHLTFESVDTEELKNLSFSFEGDSGIFKVGEGEANHYQIPNDKKLWES